MERKLTCIICPLGCDLTVQIEDKKVIGITGNTCPRGKVYAESECTNPQRVITSTVRCNDGQMVSVKTDAPIPKEKMMECMEIINNTVAELPITVGDVIVNDVFGSKIIATQNKNK
jgi:CxxC motif-containing protein